MKDLVILRWDLKTMECLLVLSLLVDGGGLTCLVMRALEHFGHLGRENHTWALKRVVERGRGGGERARDIWWIICNAEETDLIMILLKYSK